MSLQPAQQWAQDTFGHARLGDQRRTQRLVRLAECMASNVGASIVKACLTPAESEGAYRLIRNEHVDPNAIAEAGFESIAERAKQYPLMLALEDTTSLNYAHSSLVGELGHLNSGDKVRGLLVHSVLLFSPEQLQVVGLIEQRRWSRDLQTRGKRHKHAQLPYEEKEGYKWEQASRAMETRLGPTMDNVVSVCDREADIYEYLTYKLNHNQRFVVRSMQSRCIEEGDDKLYAFADTLTAAGKRTVHVQQRGGRKARDVVLEVRYAPVTLKTPANKRGDAVPRYYVGCVEKGNQPDKLRWDLLTSEPVASPEDAQRILDYYEYRWLIEEFHKAWKTGGTQVEELQMQSRQNLERVAVIKAFIATRLLQLRATSRLTQARKLSVEQVLVPLAWKLLWLKTQKGKGLPKKPPSLKWGCQTLAKLGGWKDSKRTGRPGWVVLWDGWFKLETMIDGYRLGQALEQEKI